MQVFLNMLTAWCRALQERLSLRPFCSPASQELLPPPAKCAPPPSRVHFSETGHRLLRARFRHGLVPR